jgi:hypothetical protein
MARQRFFFTDPISAAWMVKAFRFKVMAGSFCIQPESLDAFFQLLGTGAKHDKYEVHPESIPLLEPKPGDVVEEAEARTKIKKLTPANFPLTGSGYVIIQRSGRPFFTPTKEG